MAGVNRPDINEIRALKKRGHDAIDRLVRLHVSKNESYRRIATKLGIVEEFAHFSTKFTKRDVLRLVEAAEAVERERRQQIKDRRAEARQKAHEKAMANAPIVEQDWSKPEPEIPTRWARIKSWLGGILRRRA